MEKAYTEIQKLVADTNGDAASLSILDKEMDEREEMPGFESKRSSRKSLSQRVEQQRRQGAFRLQQKGSSYRT
jgi:hypothetical protein